MGNAHSPNVLVPIMLKDFVRNIVNRLEEACHSMTLDQPDGGGKVSIPTNNVGLKVVKNLRLYGDVA